MATEQGDVGLTELIQPTPENRLHNVTTRPGLGKAGDGERRQGPSAHGIDIAQRIRRRDLPVKVGVVDDRSEEVDGLDECRAPVPPVHTRIVAGPEVDQNPPIVRRR